MKPEMMYFTEDLEREDNYKIGEELSQPLIRKVFGSFN